MHLWQAIILGGFYWFSFLGVFDHSLNLLFYQPLTSALLVGLVMGDIPTAMIVGATIQPMFLGQTQAGWVITNDNAAAGIITASVVIASGMDIKSAMACLLYTSKSSSTRLSKREQERVNMRMLCSGWQMPVWCIKSTAVPLLVCL